MLPLGRVLSGKANLLKFRKQIFISLFLPTGRQPGTLSENSYGKSYTTIWISKGGVQGELPFPVLVPPLLRSRFLYSIFHMNFQKKCPVAFQWSVFKLTMSLNSVDQPCFFRPIFHTENREQSKTSIYLWNFSRMLLGGSGDGFGICFGVLLGCSGAFEDVFRRKLYLL